MSIPKLITLATAVAAVSVLAALDRIAGHRCDNGDALLFVVELDDE